MVLEVLARTIRQEEEIRGIQIGKEVKLSLWAEDMTLYTKKPQDYKKTLPKPIHEFGKVGKYEI
jgi:hypothetical protein